MKTHYKFALVAAPLAIIAFLLSRVIWPDIAGMQGPEPSLIPHFIFLSALESVSFGIGVAFAIFGWPFVLRVMPQHKILSVVAFISIVWMLVSWWPHDNMHRINGMDNFTGLLRIEYTFHFTLILAGFILAMYFWKQIARNT